jgi:hypothetical protein
MCAFEPSAYEGGPSALLVRADSTIEALGRHGMSFVWGMLGEKRVLGPWREHKRMPLTTLSGAYALRDGRPFGFMKLLRDRYSSESGAGTALAIVRTESQ